MTPRVVPVLLGFLPLLSSCLLAQSPEASLVGQVKDPSGARVPRAHVRIESLVSGSHREMDASDLGEFRFDLLRPGRYRVRATAQGFVPSSRDVVLMTGVAQSVEIALSLAPGQTTVEVREPVDATQSVIQSVISGKDLAGLPLQSRSFANMSYFAPMTEPVEPSDPTKARITAVSFAGSSGLNVDLSVDGGDNNDDYIGGFLQNYSPEAIDEFAVATAQHSADTSRTNGGSVMITTRRGQDDWHGSLADYFRANALSARNTLDNPEPNPKQPFSRNAVATSLGGPIAKGKVWFFTTFEHVDENASIAYSNESLTQFRALAGLASLGLIPGVPAIAVPTSSPVRFRDTLFSGRVDWHPSERSEWFLRGAIDRYATDNDRIQQGALPSTGLSSLAHFGSLLLHNDFQFGPQWFGVLTLGANYFHYEAARNAHYGFALAFPFTTTFSAISGFETFGDNQFATPISAFPVVRDQQKYQLRYDLARSATTHSLKFGLNFIHEPVLSGRLSDTPETLVTFPEDPSFYLANARQFPLDFASHSVASGGGTGVFQQSVRRLGLYAQDTWRVSPSLTLNLGVRYDTSFGLFVGSGREQDQNPAFLTLKTLGIPLVSGIPHDDRGALAPRLGFAYSPRADADTVLRGGFGLYYHDLSQVGFVDALRAVNAPVSGLLPAGAQGALIDPNYKTPYALQASLGFEKALGHDFRLVLAYEHQQGVHQYRRYEYVSGFTLPATAPSISLFRTDNRSRYDGFSVGLQHRFSSGFELSAHYTLASASTFGAVVGELFDYVNGVSNPTNPFGPGDHGPSGEDVRHRFVLIGRVPLPGGFELATVSQFESPRPFTIATPVDVNSDGDASNDRAVVNGVQTTLDEFRGSAFAQVDVRVSRPFRILGKTEVRPFLEVFNLFNRVNPGNNYVQSIAALPVPPGQLSNVTQFCLNASCSLTRPITLQDLRVPAGSLGNAFGPGTTVGIPFSAQLGLRVNF